MRKYIRECLGKYIGNSLGKSIGDCMGKHVGKWLRKHIGECIEKYWKMSGTIYCHMYGETCWRMSGKIYKKLSRKIYWKMSETMIWKISRKIFWGMWISSSPPPLTPSCRSQSFSHDLKWIPGYNPVWQYRVLPSKKKKYMPPSIIFISSDIDVRLQEKYSTLEKFLGQCLWKFPEKCMGTYLKRSALFYKVYIRALLICHPWEF